MHDRAQPAAVAAQCAMAQGKFWDYHDKLFANQRQLADADLQRYATELELDAEAFAACREGEAARGDVLQDFIEGQQLGVSGTPAFFVNGRILTGANSFEAFRRVIDEELQRNR